MTNSDVHLFDLIFRERYEQTFGKEYDPNLQFYFGGEWRTLSLPDRISYVGKLQAVESNFDVQAQNLLMWLNIKENRLPLEALVGLEYEVGGWIACSNEDFEFKFVEDPTKRQLLQYIKEASDGDFTHGTEIIYYIHDAIKSLRATGYTDDHVLIKEWNAFVEASKKIKREELHPAYQQALLKMLRIIYNKSYIPDLKLPESPNVVGKFHTHPYYTDRDSSPPSKTDIRNSHIFGPEFIFSFTPKDKVTVYTVKKGESKIVREYIII